MTPDGKELWVAGRFDGQVYAFDTTTGGVTKIDVGIEPHGLTVWPQPGKLSLGHTGNMRWSLVISGQEKGIAEVWRRPITPAPSPTLAPF